MGWLSKTLGSIIDSIIEAKKDETEAYDSSATVLRDDGDILWVHIPGGVDETPIKKTIDAKRCDVIQVRVGGGTAWATGNQTAPPTDDTKAKEADTKAKDANILAKLAKKTADKAGKTATNYLSWSAEYGLIVSEDATEDPTEMQGGNTRITSDGMEVYHGQTRVAHFCDEVVLGDEDGANAYLDPDTFNITNVDGAKFFSVDMDGTSRGISYSKRATGTAGVSASASVSISDSPDLDFIPSGSAVSVALRLLGGGFLETVSWNVTKGTSSITQATSSAGVTFTLTYDGVNFFEIVWNNTAQRTYALDLYEVLQANNPSYTLGTRKSNTKGAFSVALGEGISAEASNQIGLGKYNEGNYSNLLEIGNGTVSAPKNIFAIGINGTIKSPCLQAGTFSTTNVSAGTYQDFSVTFDTSFPYTPIVTASFKSTSTASSFGRCTLSVHTITTSGFKVRVFNGETSDSRSPDINWIALDAG